jgi:hypothetical protein
VASEERKIFIIIKEAALMQMILSALEAFAIKHLEKRTHNKYLETYGLLWGNFTKISGNNTQNFIYTISHLTIDTSAKRSKNSVEPNDEALILKKDIITSFWPYYKFLGDFHTHPYKKKENFNYQNVERDKLFDFSKQDFASIEDSAEYWYEHNYRVGIVVTIIDMEKAIKRVEQIKNNLLVFNLGNYRLWIKGYWTSYKKQEDKIDAKLVDNVYLSCPHLTGLHEFSQFGRFRHGRHEEGEIG